MDRQKVTIHAAARIRSGSAGWAAVLACGRHRKTVLGSLKDVTPNRLAALAVLASIKALKQPCVIDVRSSSHYVARSLPSMRHWARNGWKRRDKDGAEVDVANADVWREILSAIRHGDHALGLCHHIRQEDLPHSPDDLKAADESLMMAAGRDDVSHAEPGMPPVQEEIPGLAM